MTDLVLVELVLKGLLARAVPDAVKQIAIDL